MKIQINESESYEISLPSMVSPRELSVIIDKLNAIHKIISRQISFTNPLDNLESINENNEQQVRQETNRPHIYKSKTLTTPAWQKLKNDRDLVVRLFTIFYNSKGDDQLLKFFQENDLMPIWYGRSYLSSSSYHNIKHEIHHIKPEEVNLIRFPHKGEQVDNNIRIKPIEYHVEYGTTTN